MIILYLFYLVTAEMIQVTSPDRSLYLKDTKSTTNVTIDSDDPLLESVFDSDRIALMGWVQIEEFSIF